MSILLPERLETARLTLTSDLLMDSPDDTRQPVLCHMNNAAKPQVSVLVNAGGRNPAQNATANPQKKKRQNRQRKGKKKFKTLNAQEKRLVARLGLPPPWLRSLSDPCNSREVRIPDGQMFPTATGSLRVIRMITASGVGQRTLIGFFPEDIQSGTTGTNVVSLFHYYCNAANDAATFSNADAAANLFQFTNAIRTSAPYSSLSALMKSARVVSACAKLTYTGSALINGGSVTGFVLSHGQIAGAASSILDTEGEDVFAVITQHSTPASVRNLPFTMQGALRDGMEIFKYPNSKRELDFEDAVVRNSAAPAVISNVLDAGSMGFLIDWSDAAQQVMIEYYVNFEYNPYSFAQANTKTVPFEPSVLTRAGKMAENIYNLIRPLVPYVRPVMRHVGEFLASQGSAGIHTQPTIEDL